VFGGFDFFVIDCINERAESFDWDGCEAIGELIKEKTK
jgi:hypothetical protein